MIIYLYTHFPHTNTHSMWMRQEPLREIFVLAKNEDMIIRSTHLTVRGMAILLYFLKEI